MPRNTREIIVRDRTEEINSLRDKFLNELYTIHKYTLEEISGINIPKTPQGIFKIIKANRQ